MLQDFILILLFKELQIFILVFGNTVDSANKVERNSYPKYFLPRVNITKNNILTDDWNFYDQPTNEQIKTYDDIRQIATGQGDDYNIYIINVLKTIIN